MPTRRDLERFKFEGSLDRAKKVGTFQMTLLPTRLVKVSLELELKGNRRSTFERDCWNIISQNVLKL